MALGSVWESGSWPDSTWVNGAWAEAVLTPADFTLQGVDLIKGDFNLFFDKLSNAGSGKGTIIAGVNSSGQFSVLAVGSNNKVLIANSAAPAGVEWGFPGFGASSELTIASGEITVSDSVDFRNHSVDTQADAASDDLDTINGGNAGEMLVLSAANDGRTVVLKNGTSLKLSSDYSLNNIYDTIILICVSLGVWKQFSRSSNGS